MPAISASAPGKVILLGEHAVVYGRPALAVPLEQVRARAAILPLISAPPGTVEISAPDIGLEAGLTALPTDDPIGYALRLAIHELGGAVPAFQIKISSTIPLAAGLGSGAAVSATILRAVSAFAGRPFGEEVTNRLAFEVEKIHHGTPSGIDNTVVTYARPVFFIKGQPPLPLYPGGVFTFLVGVTGTRSSTARVVADVRQAWQADPEKYDLLFDEIGSLVESARQAVEHGQPELLGQLMNANQARLEQMGVSSSELEALIAAARHAGALGAKLSGAGRGGNMIALVQPEDAEAAAAALQAAGVVRILTSQVRPAASQGGTRRENRGYN